MSKRHSNTNLKIFFQSNPNHEPSQTPPAFEGVYEDEDEEEEGEEEVEEGEKRNENGIYFWVANATSIC